MKLASLAVIGLALGLAACSSSADSDAAAAGRGGAGAGGPGGAGGIGTSPLGGLGSGNFRPGSQEELAGSIGDRVLFATDSVQVGADQRPILSRQAEWLNRYRQVQVTIEGHADERGTREYNLALGQRRANAARDLLVADGVASTRIQTISYGKDRPVELGSNQAAWAQNRRAVTVVR
ncbi:peptidoglycan-associated lipoprotein Pal [Roseomonas stagni]|uniref:Peptidoglycan-associated lipoprotein n=1 Tax=Falsiroseomonas algicola TaxID=2716930 RepID=A0A6M1LKM2_9PROT|nr:peptidoglycan-associated lipoprotein Pal [Falsiroseomonas algicola]NGM20682.1 peptidoglycan-associated lipoprotein Pal [Falsiroseomonas algicola]